MIRVQADPFDAGAEGDALTRGRRDVGAGRHLHRALSR